MSERKNVSISGMGSITGGIYGKVSLSGSGKITGDIDAYVILISGTGNIKGNITTKEIDISGSGKVDGYVKSDKITSLGNFKCTNNVECEEFKSCGEFKINGMLNAENIKIDMNGKCYVSEIGCQSIYVKKCNNNEIIKGIKVNMFLSYPKLVVDIIEGDEISLENTIAKIVRGKNVTIGDGCDIQVIEYMGNISVSDKSNVREKNKI